MRRVFADSDGETSACGAPQGVNEVRLVGNSRHKKKGGRRNAGPPSEMVAGGGFEPPTFGLCDLTQLSLRVGLYLHPVPGMLAIQSLRLPRYSGAWFGIALSPHSREDLGSTDFDD